MEQLDWGDTFYQACNIQYVGQTTQELRKRHYGHRSDIRNGTAGLGRHFYECHGQGKDLKKNEEQPACQARLDRLEADLQHRLRGLNEHGGINIRDENLRRPGL